MGLSQQKYWSGLPCPPPGELPDPGIEPLSPASPTLQSLGFSRQEHPPHREGCHLGMTFSHMKRISQLLHFKEQLLGGRSIRPDQKLQVKSWNKVVLFRKNLWEKARVGWFKRIALKHIYYRTWNRSPVQVRCMRQGARGWCTEMTERDGMGREVGGGFRMGHMYPHGWFTSLYGKTTTIL